MKVAAVNTQLLGLVLASVATAQSPPAKQVDAKKTDTAAPTVTANPWQPTALPRFGFQNAAIAKIYQNSTGDAVLGLITFQEVTATYQTTKLKIEERTRTVEDPDTGQTIAQTYTVQVPYTETIEKLVLQRRRFEVPLQHAQFRTTSGQTLTATQAQDILGEPARCFLVDRAWKANIEPFFAQMLSENLLVISYDAAKAKEIALPAENPGEKAK